ncbi:MAG TPA: MlaD family protein [Kofleriaceae bacterium]|nr:MlaD family protein [Kofleriaceae bacterium]
MRWLTRLTTFGILAVLAGVIVVGAIEIAQPPAVTGGFRTSALFRDASGLPIGSRVVIAGVNVGRIESLIVEGNQARVVMRLQDDVVLCDDSWATKKATSALGDNYVELSPGDADPVAETGCAPPHLRLVSGEPVRRVVEAASTDRVLRGIQNAMPRLDEGMASAEAFMDEGREWVSGPFAARVAQLDRDLQGDLITGPLRDSERAADDLDRWTAELETDVADVAPTANRRMDDFAAEVAGTTADLRDGKAEVKDALGGARARIDEVDPYLDDAADTIAALANPKHERAGRLSKLIHDPELADDLTDITAAGAEFTGSLNKFKNVIGFRSEVNILARQPRYFVTAEIAARADSFYYVEMEKGHWGDVPEPQLDDATGTASWTRRTLIAEHLRFTAQWGKRFGPLALRFGVKESMFGVGVDGVFGDGILKLSLDVMDSSYDRVPRVKLAAAFAVYRTLYVIGGIDDALVEGANLPIQDWPAEAGEPIQFEKLHYGRDFFLGLSLNFTDTDMDRLLFVYGGLLGAILSR